jgi:cytochrome c oxidase subunit 1
VTVATSPPDITHGKGGGGRESTLWSWITTTDHKRIGILYGATALIFFLVGGLEAVLIRL